MSKGLFPRSNKSKFRSVFSWNKNYLLKYFRNLILPIGLSLGVSLSLYAAVLPSISSELLETQMLSPLDSATGDLFGYSVDVSDTTIIVGAYEDDDTGDSSGTATIYERQFNGWVEVAKLIGDDTVSFDKFGYSVAVEGNLAIVGAPGNAAAYIFEKQADGSWLQQAKLFTPTLGLDDDYAKSVAISGNTVVIGAAGTFSKSAYVFERGLDGSWGEPTQLYNDVPHFGFSVAIDSDRIVVGALITNLTTVSAPVTIFEKQINGSWLQTAEISVPQIGINNAPVEFGRSVAVSGKNIIVGSDSYAAYIFEQQSDLSWLRTRILTRPAGFYLNYNYGRVVDIEGSRALVSDKYATATSKGMAHIYEQQMNGQWVHQIGLIQSDEESNSFAHALSMSGDTVVSGAYFSDLVALNSGATYVYDIPALSLSSASFFDIGVLAESYSSYTQAYDSSYDGGIIVGRTYLDGVSYAFTWTEANGLSTPLVLPGNYTDSTAAAISSDTSTITGHLWYYNGSYEAYRWDINEGLVLLGDLTGGIFDSRANDISADGAVIVGYGTSDSKQEAVRWDKGSGIVSLSSDLNTSTMSVANAVSADGTVIVGQSDGQAFRWTVSGQVDWLGTLPGHSSSVANSVSSNGKYVVGESISADGLETEAFLWNLETGIIGLGHIPRTTFSKAEAISDDGQVVIGSYGSTLNISKTFVWDTVHGIRQLDDILIRNYGVNVPGIMGQGLGLANDGNTLVGLFTKDQSGHGYTAKFSSEQPDNTFPQLNILSPIADISYPLNEAINFSASANDTEDGDVGATIKWLSNIDGVIGYGDNLTSSTLSSGVHKITASVWDSKGATSFVHTNIFVNNAVVNGPPTAVLTTVNESYINTPIVFDASLSTDPNGDPLVYRWEFGDGQTAFGPTIEHTYAQSGSYTVTLGVFDGNTETIETKVINILTGTPSAVISSLDTVNKNENIIFDASLSIDPNNEPLTYSWDFGDGLSAQGINVGHTYNNSGTYSVTLSVFDGNTTNSLTKIVSVINQAPTPVITSLDIVNKGQNIAFDATLSNDLNGDPLTYLWDFGDGTTAIGVSVNHPFTTTGMGLATVTLTVSDGEISKSVIKQITIINHAPTPIITSVDTLNKNVNVIFDASLSTDVDGDTLTYHWNFGDGGLTATTAIVNRSYSASGSYTVTLTVSDGATTSEISKVVTVSNQAPVAVITSLDSANKKEGISFDGALSTDINSDVLSYNWDFGDGNTATGVNVNHTYKLGGTFVVTLTVDDGEFSSVENHTINIVNEAPIAVMTGPDTVNKNNIFTLDSSLSSDVNADELSYTWDFGDGTIITGARNFEPHSYASSGNFIATLTVSDGESTSTTSKTINSINSAPIAVIGHPGSVSKNVNAIFDGSFSSDYNNDTLTYLWSFGDGTTSTEAISNHTYVSEGNYTVTLTVNDGEATHTKSLYFYVVNHSPVSKINSLDSVDKGVGIKFDAYLSTDQNNDELSYSWDFGEGGSDVGVSVNHVYVTGGNYTVTLTVSDGDLLSTQTKVISVANNNPNANAGTDLSVKQKQIVTLDGSLSSDADIGDDVVSYSWSQISGVNVTLSDFNTQAVTFKAPRVRRGTSYIDLLFELTVTDKEGLTSKDTIAVRDYRR